MQNYFSIVENPTSNGTNLYDKNSNELCTDLSVHLDLQHLQYFYITIFPLFSKQEEEFNPRLNIKHTKLLSSSRGKLKRVAPSKKQDFSRRYTSLRFHTAAVSIVAESRNDPIAIFHRANATLQALATLFFFSSVASVLSSGRIRARVSLG